ncbi:hypothetical protein [Actinoplanes sp. NPDC026619]|uniref:hypothetical protein n=1 Tax=Actinoplanes sp. NPDC026619 TaxID=3155798 RepID=UPI0033CDDD9E
MRIRPLRLALLLGTLAAATLAVPASPAFASLSLYRQSNTSVSDDSSPKTVTVSCGTDDVVGMGGHINGSNDVVMSKMFVDTGLRTVTVQGIESTAVTTAWSVDAYAVCAPAGSVTGLNLQQHTSTSDPYYKSGITATCTGSNKVFGGGYKLELAAGKAAMDELNFSSSLGSVSSTAYVHDPTVGNFTLTTQAICGTPATTMSLQTWTSASNSISPKIETTQTCPGTTQPSGTGAVLTGLVGSGSVAGLEPHLSNQAAEVTGRELGFSGNGWLIQAQAICIG